VVARELTKIHQEFLRGTTASIIGQLPDPRGEFTVIIGPKTADESLPLAPSDAEVVAEFWHSTEIAGSTRRAAVSALARKYGRTSREVYGLIEQAKKSGE
jgi:16S rRNA (cytidine1402-2'-O)-methyltransferase